MTLPFDVQILTRRYRVVVDNENDGFGQCNNIQAIISINVKRCETSEIVARTLFHEIGHAFAWESGLSNFMASSTEEMFVENLSALLVNLPGTLWGN